jgi:hypothetical protein
MAETEKAVVVASWPKSPALHHKLIGFLAVGAFIVIWLSSACSPFFLLFAVVKGSYELAAVLMIVTIAAYMPWKRGAVSQFIQTTFNTYHPAFYKSASIVLEKSDEELFKKREQSFFAIHPHGAFCLGWSILFCSDLFDHVRFCFAPSLYASPFFRLFSRAVGRPGSAARSSMISYMKTGQSLALPPGGFEEATLTSTKIDRVFIKKRTGFVKLCLIHGIPIRPVYVFGENKLYYNIQGLWKLRLKLNRYGIPTIIVWGQPLAPLIPKSNADIRIVIGKPLQIPKIDSPTKDDVALWHKRYIAALTNLFEEHKEDAFGVEASKTTKLEVW